MFRLASRILRSEVPQVNFLNVETFKFANAPSTRQEAFLIKPVINAIGSDNGAMLTHIKSPAGQDDPIVSIDNTIANLFVVTSSGRVFSQGSGKSGELGFGKDVVSPTELKEVKGLPPVKQVVSGKYFAAALTKDGSVFAWGDGGSFFNPLALGVGNKRGIISTPTPVELPTPIASLAAGDEHVIALDTSGMVWTWGNGEFGRLGLGSSSSAYTPQLVESLADYKTKLVRTGSNFSLAVTDVGVFSWGKNDSGQLGTKPESFMMDMYSMEALPSYMPFKQNEDMDGAEGVIPELVECFGRRGFAYASSNHGLYRWGQKTWMVPQCYHVLDATVTVAKLAVAAGKRNFYLTNDKHIHFVQTRGLADPRRLVIPGEVVDIFSGHSLGVVAKVSDDLVASLPEHHTVASAPAPGKIMRGDN